MQLTLPPHNTEAEMQVLGTILMQSDQLEVALENLSEDDFYHPKHQTIFETYRSLRKSGQVIDLVHLPDALKRSGNLDRVGGVTYLVELAEHTFSTAHFESHCSLIREKSLARKLISFSQDVQGRAFREQFDKVADLIEYAQRGVLQLDQFAGSANTLHEVHEIIKDSLTEIEKRYLSKATILGISSGFRALDELVNGFKPGELIILAARPSMGKTACSLSLAPNIALGLKKRVAYFSVEMPKETLVMRMLASRAGIALDRIMIGRLSDLEWPRLISAAGDIADSRLLIDESNPLSPNELKSRCRKVKMNGGLDCVIVDYLQLMRLKDQRVETREREVAEISATLKAVAKELQIPVIALAQLNREADKRPDKRPNISDIRESGSIEMDADVIMMLYREDYYDREIPDVQGLAEIIVGKNRNGRTGVAQMRFDPASNRFSDR